MIIYLYGPDSYKRQEKLKWYKDKFKEKHSALTVEHFNLSESGQLERLKDFAAAQSLFDNFKFGVIDGIAEIESKELDGVFNLSFDSKILTLIVSVEKELPKDFKIFKNDKVICHEFKLLAAAIFAKFVQEEAQKRHLKLQPATVNFLARNYSSDTWGLITELDKLTLGGGAEVIPEEQNFFQLFNQIQRSGPVGQRLAALERILFGNEPAMIFNFLASRSSGATKTKMADYDAAIKSGKLEYEEALIDAILA